eukprot:TRINITY_DN8739_c0_g1_i3.p1 TRINITY_DN8739_c0_g1~~TRINITY_DN8739_c0_g1_i3.p1  ORF type:complete len:2412 (+),score=913.63 TRINITY_DN8739_c0_g1_i3:92-7327(+)
MAHEPSRVRDLKFGDKLFLEPYSERLEAGQQHVLALAHIGDDCLPVVEQYKRDEIPREFERCVFQLEVAERTDSQQLWGEAAEAAKYVTYGQRVKLCNIFTSRYLSSVADDAAGKVEQEKEEVRTKCVLVRGCLPGAPEHASQVFRLRPPNKFSRDDGERVRLEDQVVIESCSAAVNLQVTNKCVTTLWLATKEADMQRRGVAQPPQIHLSFASKEQQGGKGTSWKVEPYETDAHFDKKTERADQYVPAGSAVVLFHRGAGGFLQSGWQVPADGGMPGVWIDRHRMQKATYHVQDLPYSSNAIWIIEGSDVRQGGPVHYARHQRYHFRLRHMATSLYVALKKREDGKSFVTTTYDPADPGTLLAAHPADAHDIADGLTVNAFAALCFHPQGTGDRVYFHASGEYTAVEPIQTIVSSADVFKEASLGTTGELQRLEFTTKASEAFEDVFAIRAIRPVEKQNLIMICNTAATLERFEEYYKDLDRDRKDEVSEARAKARQELELRGVRQHAPKRSKGAALSEQPVSSEEAIRMLRRSQKSLESVKLLGSTVRALTMLVCFCTAQADDSTASPFESRGPPIRRHQQMLFGQNVHQLVFQVLRAPLEYGKMDMRKILNSRSDSDNQLRKIFRLAYRLVKQMVRGAKDLALHMVANDGDRQFIEKQLAEVSTRPEDPNVADAYMQIICDNDRLLGELSPLQLESFLWLIPQFGRKATYMSLLAACCTCDNKGLRNSQDILVQRLRWLDHRDKLVSGEPSEKMLLFFPSREVDEQIQVRQLNGFPPSTKQKIERFKRRFAEGDVEGYDDDSSGDSQDSEGNDRPRRSQLPYIARYAAASRSALPPRTHLQIKHVALPVLKGVWVWACSLPCIIPRWSQRWLQLHDGCLVFAATPLSQQSLAIPVVLLQSVAPTPLHGWNPPEGKSGFGVSLVYSDLQCVADSRQKRLLLCAKNMQDRNELVTALRRQRQIARERRDDYDFDDRLSDDPQVAAQSRRGVRIDDDFTDQAEGASAEWDTRQWVPVDYWADPGRPREERRDPRKGTVTVLPQGSEEDVRFFERSLHFMASLCVDSNASGIRFVQRRVSAAQVLAGIVLPLQHRLADSIRSGYVKLAKHMFVADGRHLEVLQRKGGPELLHKLQNTVYDFITHNSRQEAGAHSRNLLMVEMLDLLTTMVRSGCYAAAAPRQAGGVSESDLQALFTALLSLLDGTSDQTAADECTGRRSGAAASDAGSEPSPRHPGSPRTQLSRGPPAAVVDTGGGVKPEERRFAWSERMQLVMEIKLQCCSLLDWLFAEAGERPDSVQINKWMSEIGDTDPRLGRHEGAVLQLDCDLLTQVLLDVTLYRGYPKLFRAALRLVLVHLSGSYSDPLSWGPSPPRPAGDDDDSDSDGEEEEEEDRAVNRLARILKLDLLRGNTQLAVNLFRHFRESEEDELTVALIRVFKKVIYLHPCPDPKEPKKVPKHHIEHMQGLLNNLSYSCPSQSETLGISALMTQLIESRKEHVVQEALKFGHFLLRGGNREVQDTLLHYFLSLNDEAFFTCIRDRISKAVKLIKDTESADRKPGQTTRGEEAHGEIPTVQNDAASRPEQTNEVYRRTDLFHLRSVLRFLQLFCEGHNLRLQDYLRQQADNVRSCNLVKETITALSWLLKIECFDKYIYDQVKQAMDSLTEYCQGPCSENQKVLMANNYITEKVNEVLALKMDTKGEDGEPVISTDEKEELWATALTMLLSVLEGVEEPEWPKRMIRALRFEPVKQLLQDVWVRRDSDSALDLGFAAVILMRTLCPYDDSLPSWLEKCAGYSFYTALTGRIEIWRDQALVRVYFRIPFICSNLSDKTKQELLWNVRRDTPTARITDFVNRAEELIYEIEYYEEHFIKKAESVEGSWFPNAAEWRRWIKFKVNENVRWLDNCMIALAFVINALACHNYVSTRPDITRKPFQGHAVQSDTVQSVIVGLIVLLALVCSCLLLDFWWAKAPLIAHHRDKKNTEERKKKAQRDFSMGRYIDMFWREDPDLDRAPGRRQLAAARPAPGTAPATAASADGAAPAGAARASSDIDYVLTNDKNQSITHKYSAYFTLKAIRDNTTFLFLLSSVTLAVLGATVSPFCCAGHLAAIIHRSALLQNVIRAVTKNSKSLLLTVIMMFVAIYFFSVLGFVLFRQAFKMEDPPCKGEEDCDEYHCDTLMRCFLFGVTAGLRQGGGVADVMQAPEWNDPYIVTRILFDFLFFVVVIVILLSIVFGIIIDTFAELRTEKTKIDTDIRSRCFICGIESAQFDRQADGFEHHIKNDHNMWNYIFFIHFLRKKNTDEYTGQESFVYNMIEREDLSFFPLNKALCLLGKQEDDDQQAELLNAHQDTDGEVARVERELTDFDAKFRQESANLHEYVKDALAKVTQATMKRHSIMNGLKTAESVMRSQDKR